MALAGDRQYGAVTRLTDRGFGFITVSPARRSFFFHASGVAEGGFDALTLHQPVSFILESDDTGRPRAVDVRPLAMTTTPAAWPAPQGAEVDGDDDNTYAWGEAS